MEEAECAVPFTTPRNERQLPRGGTATHRDARTAIRRDIVPLVHVPHVCSADVETKET